MNGYEIIDRHRNSAIDNELGVDEAMSLAIHKIQDKFGV